MKQTILHLDDDYSQHERLLEKLKDRFNLIPSSNAIDAIAQLKTKEVDAIISDLHMPIINGFKFHEMLKEHQLNHIPFFFLSSDITDKSKVNGLMIGAEDFFSLAMSADELYFRITNRINETALCFKDIKINTKKIQAFRKDSYLDLTQIEFKFLFLLIKAKDQIVTRDAIKSFIWPKTIVLDKTINSHLTNLRLKIEDENLKIVSVKNIGIKFQTT